MTHGSSSIQECLAAILDTRLQPLDLLPQETLVEKLIALVLQGVPAGPPKAVGVLEELAGRLTAMQSDDVRVVIFGGGTGLANIVGGDSRKEAWLTQPFAGIKEFFPQTTSIVCITDDGGSTGELLKDLPIIGLGDLRHVLLSSMQQRLLQRRYQVGEQKSHEVAAILFRLFNYRFEGAPQSHDAMLAEIDVDLGRLPRKMATVFARLLADLFERPELARLLCRRHCLGNLLLTAAIMQAGGHPALEDGELVAAESIMGGLEMLGRLIGVPKNGVLPCTTTAAQLKIRYVNGVLVSGEHKSSQARRNCPVDRVFVEFSHPPEVPERVLAAIARADLILFAPGSLYTSIIPILQVPGLADAVRANQRAQKVLIANLWAQRGETDLVEDDPQRRFHVSDLLRAYHRNIPGGVDGLFRQVMALSLNDIPGSVLQRYAVEGKVPIFFDRRQVVDMGFVPVEACIYSATALASRMVLQHDPAALGVALRTAYAVRGYFPATVVSRLAEPDFSVLPVIQQSPLPPARRFEQLARCLAEKEIAPPLQRRILDICWRHPDISPAHVGYFDGIDLVATAEWRRCQEWDRIYAFFDPGSRRICLRQDSAADPVLFEIGLLVALGQSLLGNYAAHKELLPVGEHGGRAGKIYRLRLRPQEERHCYLDEQQLLRYLELARMIKQPNGTHTRLINGDEGFTPPGLLFGLLYAWYLDNQFVSHVEYKMAIRRTPLSDLIPEQRKTRQRRSRLIDFFRQDVFGYRHEAFAGVAGDG